ncbi:MAG: tetratricopeptide repeat protein [Planctomycetes bacterium]|nr:tetratricopeptide repeat protein [Planctomycetota bacterium]MBL7037408.1 tetratricopeptide repeat protein [Pirellulaceae bacterium]
MSPLDSADPIDWDEEQMQTLDCLKQLPHWACVAFAARCVRRAWYAIRKRNAGASMLPPHAIENAVALAEYSARTGQPRVGADETAKAALMAGGPAQDMQHVAGAAAQAALAVAEGPEGSEKGAFLAFTESVELVRLLDDVEMLQSLRADLELLLERCRKENWNSKTPIREDLFPPVDQPLKRAPLARKKTNGALDQSRRDSLDQDEAVTWTIREDVAQWQPGELMAFVGPRLPVLWAAVGAVVVAPVAAGLLRLYAGPDLAVPAIGGVVCGLLVYRLIRGKKKLVAFDWGQEAMVVRSGLRKREYPFRDIRRVRVKAVEEHPDDEDESVEYSGLLEIETPDQSLAVLHGLFPDQDPAEACESLEKIAQWLAVALDRPYESAAIATDEAGATDKQLAAQQVALGQMALKKAKYAEHLGDQDSERYVSEALAHFGEANRLDPTNIDSLLEVAELCSSRSHHSQAIAAYGMAIDSAPERGDVYCSRAFLYQLDNQYDLAITDYSEAIRLDPEDNSIYRNRGNAHAEAGSYAEAVADLTKCLELTDAPDDSKLLDEIRLSNRSSVYAERADAYRKQDDLERAMADVRKAIELEPANPYAQLVHVEVRKAADT